MNLCDFPCLFILEAQKWEGCGILGIVGHHSLPASMFSNCVFKVAEAPCTPYRHQILHITGSELAKYCVRVLCNSLVHNHFFEM